MAAAGAGSALSLRMVGSAEATKEAVILGAGSYVLADYVYDKWGMGNMTRSALVYH
jgi:hypothetical protein